MIISSLPFSGDAFADDICETNCFPDYKYAEPNILFDVSEQYMLLPFLEDTVRNSNSNNLDDKLYQEAVMDTDRAGLYLEIGQMRPCLQDTVINSSDSDQAECFDPQLFMKNLPELSDVVSNFQTNLLPEEASKRKSVTLVLDLDGKYCYLHVFPYDLVLSCILYDISRSLYHFINSFTSYGTLAC